MESNRIPLSANTVLQGPNQSYFLVRTSSGEADVVAFGGSSIVYRAYYVENDATGAPLTKNEVLMKECFPHGIRGLRRDMTTNAIAFNADTGETDVRLFAQYKERFHHEHAVYQAICATPIHGDLLLQREQSSLLQIGAPFEQFGNLYLPIRTEAGCRPFSMLSNLSPYQLCRCVFQACIALRTIHDAGYLHLDLSPWNILLQKNGAVKILDLNSSRAIQSGCADESNTIHSYTNGFSAPELYHPDETPSVQSDYYSIGALLFYFLNDFQPADRWELNHIESMDLTSALTARMLRKDALALAAAIIKKCLAFAPANRYSNLDQMGADLDRLCHLLHPREPHLASSFDMPKSTYIKRETDQRSIHEHFQSGAHAVFLIGDGGIGKSQLVRGYLEAYRDTYDTTVLSSLESNDSFHDFLLKLPIKNLDYESDRDSAIESRICFLSKLDEKTLIVIDNYDAHNDQIDWFVEHTGTARLLFTTRLHNPCSSKYAVCWPVPLLSRENLLTIFYGRKTHKRDALPNEEKSQCYELFEQLGFNTLAVEIAGALCSSRGITPQQLLDEVCINFQAALSTGSRIRYKQEGTSSPSDIHSAYDIIANLFRLSNIANSDSVALDVAILQSLALTPGYTFDLREFCQRMDVSNGKYLLQERIEALAESSLLNLTDDESLSLHPLIREVVRAEWPQLNKSAEAYVLNTWRLTDSLLYAADIPISFGFVERTESDDPENRAIAGHQQLRRWIQLSLQMIQHYKTLHDAALQFCGSAFTYYPAHFMEADSVVDAKTFVYCCRVMLDYFGKLYSDHRTQFNKALYRSVYRATFSALFSCAFLDIANDQDTAKLLSKGFSFTKAYELYFAEADDSEESSSVREADIRTFEIIEDAGLVSQLESRHFYLQKGSDAKSLANLISKMNEIYHARKSFLLLAKFAAQMSMGICSRNANRWLKQEQPEQDPETKEKWSYLINKADQLRVLSYNHLFWADYDALKAEWQMTSQLAEGEAAEQLSRFVAIMLSLASEADKHCAVGLSRFPNYAQAAGLIDVKKSVQEILNDLCVFYSEDRASFSRAEATYRKAIESYTSLDAEVFHGAISRLEAKIQVDNAEREERFLSRSSFALSCLDKENIAEKAFLAALTQFEERMKPKLQNSIDNLEGYGRAYYLAFSLSAVEAACGGSYSAAAETLRGFFACWNSGAVGDADTHIDEMRTFIERQFEIHSFVLAVQAAMIEYEAFEKKFSDKYLDLSDKTERYYVNLDIPLEMDSALMMQNAIRLFRNAFSRFPSSFHTLACPYPMFMPAQNRLVETMSRRAADACFSMLQKLNGDIRGKLRSFPSEASAATDPSDPESFYQYLGLLKSISSYAEMRLFAVIAWRTKAAPSCPGVEIALKEYGRFEYADMFKQFEELFRHERTPAAIPQLYQFLLEKGLFDPLPDHNMETAEQFLPFLIEDCTYIPVPLLSKILANVPALRNACADPFDCGQEMYLLDFTEYFWYRDNEKRSKFAQLLSDYGFLWALDDPEFDALRFWREALRPSLSGPKLLRTLFQHGLGFDCFDKLDGFHIKCFTPSHRRWFSDVKNTEVAFSLFFQCVEFLPLQIAAVCPVCGRRIETVRNVPVCPKGICDLDLRPAQPVYRLLHSELTECPNCGYIAPSFPSATSVTRDFLVSSVYWTPAFSSCPGQAAYFLRAAHIAVQEEDHKKAFNMFIGCAWACDDAEYAEGALYARRKALEQLEQLIPDSFDFSLDMYYVLKADLLRRIGDFDAVQKYVTNIQMSKCATIMYGVLMHEMNLSLAKDSAAHAIDEVLHKSDLAGVDDHYESTYIRKVIQLCSFDPKNIAQQRESNSLFNIVRKSLQAYDESHDFPFNSMIDACCKYQEMLDQM